MSFGRKHYTTFAAFTVLVLTACDPKEEPTPEPEQPGVQQVGDTVITTESGKLISFNRATPKTLVGTATMTGLPAGDPLVGIDYRPSDSQLYGLTKAGKLFTLKPETGVATLKSTLTAVSGDDDPYTSLGGGTFGVDFNPVADRLRVVSSSGLNLRINVDTGATTTDTKITGSTAGVSAAAYTNSVAGATSTQLYVLDNDSNVYLQDPPNNGTLTKVGSVVRDVSSGNGYDIDGRTGIGYFVVGGSPYLWTLEPGKTPIAREVSAIGDLSEPVTGMALR